MWLCFDYQISSNPTYPVSFLIGQLVRVINIFVCLNKEMPACFRNKPWSNRIGDRGASDMFHSCVVLGRNQRNASLEVMHCIGRNRQSVSDISAFQSAKPPVRLQPSIQISETPKVLTSHETMQSRNANTVSRPSRPFPTFLTCTLPHCLFDCI